MNLKARFALSMILYSVAVLGAFSGTYYIWERRAAENDQLEAQQRTLQVLASQCAGMHLASNPIGMLDFINVMRRDASIVSISCRGLDGRFTAHSDPKLIGKTRPTPDPVRSRANPRGIDAETGDIVWSAPVHAGPAQVGWGEVRFNTPVLAQSIRARLWTTLRRLLVVGILTFVLALVLGLFLSWNLSKPIMGLVSAARAIGEGDLSYQTPLVARQDEMGFLAKEMNLMARRLRQLDELKDEFISNVSHDLRSPMSAIKMYVDYMLTIDPNRGDILPRHKEMLLIIMDNAMRLGVFVTNILDAAKIKAGKLEYHIQPVKLESVVKNIHTLFKMSAQACKIDFTLNVPEDLPAVLADPVHIDQAITNLVSNAIKFSPPGGKVRLEVKPRGAMVDVSIKDTGRGISQEDLPRLFNRFQQAGLVSPQERPMKGTGLGLALVKKSVEAMGGSIRVESVLEKGSCFTISLRVEPGGAHVR